MNSNGCLRIRTTSLDARRRLPARIAPDVAIVNRWEGVSTHCDERQKDDHTGTEAVRLMQGHVIAR